MRFMLMRRTEAVSKADQLDGARAAKVASLREEMRAAGVLRVDEELQPDVAGVRVRFGNGAAVVEEAHFDPDPPLAAFAMIEVGSREEAIEWASRWAALDADGRTLVELRATGCPGGVERLVTPPAARDPALRRHAVLLKSDEAMDAGVMAPQARLDAMSRRNVEGMESGVLVGGEGLQPSAAGLRVKFSGGRPVVIDGPFAEIKELVAGYWVVQGSIEDAIEWVRRYPYPMDDAVVEIRPLRDSSAA